MDDTNIIVFALHIAGAAALLIWSVRLLRTGVERAYAIQLRAFLRRSNSSRLQAMVSGIFAALCLQSATAVAVLLSNFAVKGGVGLLAGMAILLGADVGSAVVSQVLLLRQDFLVPLLLLVGVILFLRSSRNEIRQLGRILIGIALIFVSLDMIRAATDPLIDSPATISVMRYLGADVLTSFVIGAFFAWAVHSSVAAVLFFVTLSAQGLLPPTGAAAMVLGANAGGAFLAYMLTLTAPLTARRIVVANVALRGGGAALLLVVLLQNPGLLSWLGENASRQAINLHLAFNAGLALLAMPFLNWITVLAERMMPEQAETNADMIQTTALDHSALDQPPRALACATREIMKMGETTETILRASIVLFKNWDAAAAKAIEAKTTHVQDLHVEIKLYLAKLNHSQLSEDEKERSSELATIAHSLETTADAIGTGLVDQARQLNAEHLTFSEDGLTDVEDFHDRVLSNAQLALNVLMTGAPDPARQLLQAKEKVRTAEQTLQEKHLERLRSGLKESFETSRMHQESLRILKNVNAGFAIIGYRIAARSGDLLSTRLSKKPKTGH